MGFEIFAKFKNGLKELWKAKGGTAEERALSTAQDLKTIYDKTGAVKPIEDKLPPEKKKLKAEKDSKELKKIVVSYGKNRKIFYKNNGLKGKFAPVPVVRDDNIDDSLQKFRSIILSDQKLLKKLKKQISKEMPE
mgnify:CR=1 FL=1